jgi:hypothetical protein
VIYRNYAVLGDDLVIGDRLVAEAYQEILDYLGVKCGIHKSIVSPSGTALEFAKKTFYKGTDVSPVPLKELSAATRSAAAFRAYTAKYGLPIHKALQAFGAGFHTYATVANRHLGKLAAWARSAVLVLRIPTTPTEVNAFFELGAPVKSKFAVDNLSVARSMFMIEVQKLRHAAEKTYWLLVNKELAEHAALEADKTVGEITTSILKKDKLSESAKANLVAVTKEQAEIISVLFYKLLKVQYTSAIDKAQRIMTDLNKIGALPPTDAEFGDLFCTFLELSKEVQEMQKDFAVDRPEEVDLELAKLVLPEEVRLWKAWSATLQGSVAAPTELADRAVRPLETLDVVKLDSNESLSTLWGVL